MKSSTGNNPFQSTHSLRSATYYEGAERFAYIVSIHALLAECDRQTFSTWLPPTGFNPRTPCGVRHADGDSKSTLTPFQSTHSLRSATDFTGFGRANPPVSIHALLAECDLPGTSRRLPRTGFQSTHSLRSATTLFCPGATVTESFNPRTPCGVRRMTILASPPLARFQSTHSLRSATYFYHPAPASKNVSIHALLAECDYRQPACLPQSGGFNPRTPCGVRPRSSRAGATAQGFQSTHSLRSATAPNLIHCYSTKQIILCANLPKKTVIARLLFLSIYLSIFYSQCITPIADLPGNSCELEVGAQAMFNSL